MYLEQVMPLLREGKTITRSKKWNPNSTTVILVKLQESSLKFKCVWSNGEEMSFWACYTFKTEDVLVDNWEVAG